MLRLLFLSLPLLSTEAFLIYLPHEKGITSFNRGLFDSLLTTRKRNNYLTAIIYGWDGDEDEEEETTAYTPVPYLDVESEIGPDECSPDQLGLAQSLTADPNRIGSFARLATAFSPPERGIGIQDIEHVEVTCVRENQIELEAVLCENMGCVSLSVPIKFPNECSGNWIDSGCVIQNLNDLDSKAEAFLRHETASADENFDLDELSQLNEMVPLPDWWVPPENNANLVADCENIRSLLNEAEFQDEIVVLAQNGLQQHLFGQRKNDYSVQRAKVAVVGPAGILLKVAAIDFSTNGSIQYMDVVYPFGGEPARDVEVLRALVLGVIAAADDNRTSHMYTNKSFRD